eukprot:621435-Amphidinium_carterae.1
MSLCRTAADSFPTQFDLGAYGHNTMTGICFQLSSQSQEMTVTRGGATVPSGSGGHKTALRKRTRHAMSWLPGESTFGCCALPCFCIVSGMSVYFLTRGEACCSEQDWARLC